MECRKDVKPRRNCFPAFLVWPSTRQQIFRLIAKLQRTKSARSTRVASCPMPRLEPLVVFCAAFVLVTSIVSNKPSTFNAVSSSNRTATANTTASEAESITPINNVAPIKRTYTKQARNGVHMGSGLDGPASLALEVAMYRRIETRCTAEQRQHFPSIVNYAPGRYLNQTSAGEIIWRFVFRKGYDGATGEFGITKDTALEQVALIVDCLTLAGIYHLDIWTPPQQCKNVAVDIDTAFRDGQPMISLIDFDLAAFDDNSEDLAVRSQKLQDNIRGYNRTEYSAKTSKEILKCVLGERDDDILSIKPGYVSKKKQRKEEHKKIVSVEKANVHESRRPMQPEQHGSLLKKNDN